MASLPSPALNLRQRRRLQHQVPRTSNESSAQDKNKTDTKPNRTTTLSSTSTRTPCTTAANTSTPFKIKAVPPHHSQYRMNHPSPRKKKLSVPSTKVSSTSLSSSKTTKKTHQKPAGETKDNTATKITPGNVVAKDHQMKEQQQKQPKKKEMRCKLVYTGSFGIGYTCSICKVFREWRKVYACAGEIETKGLGRHFAGKRDHKYLQFVDGTRSMSMKPLPAEILQEILQFLDYRTLCGSECTCTDWYRISHQPQFVEKMACRDRKQMQLSSINMGNGALSPLKSSLGLKKPKKNTALMAFADVVHAAVRNARNACRTIILEKETPQRIQMYETKDVRKNQIFRTKLSECSTNWIAFLLDELSSLCQNNTYRKSHPAFLTKLKFIEKELCRRKKGRSAALTKGYIECLEELRRKVQLAVRAGRKPRMGEAKIRDLKCNWRK